MGKGLRGTALERRVLRALGERPGLRPNIREALARRMDGLGFRTLDPCPASASPSARRIDQLLRSLDGDRYLEIGVDKGLTLESVTASLKVGVDPLHSVNTARVPQGTRIVSKPSDDYFRAARSASTSFDLAFVDGLHIFEQAYRDAVNAFSVLAPGGIVLMDDTIPSSSIGAIRDIAVSKSVQDELGIPVFEWMGDVFRAVLALTELHPELHVSTVLDEHHRGQTVIRRRDADGRVEPRPQAALDRFLERTHHEVFRNGIPEQFDVRPLADICDEVRSVRTRRGS